MSFWKKKDNLIITGFVVLFFVGLTVWFDVCCVRAAFIAPSGEQNAFSVPFMDENQKQHTLHQFKGKPLIVNIWATWCSVCVKKMGSLNTFAGKFQAQGGQVLAISQDSGGVPKVKAFFARHSYDNLAIYVDPSGQLLSAFGGRGLPTSIFIDAQGNEVGRLEGGFDWESPELKGAIAEHFGITL